MYNLFRS